MKLSGMLEYISDNTWGIPKSIKHNKEEAKMDLVELQNQNGLRYYKCKDDGKVISKNPAIHDLMVLKKGDYYTGYPSSNKGFLTVLCDNER